jgi:hypothetical protein
MSEVVIRDNLSEWDGARLRDNAGIPPVRVSDPAAVTREILDDPRWAEKVQKALADREAGKGQSLDAFRKSLE